MLDTIISIAADWEELLLKVSSQRNLFSGVIANFRQTCASQFPVSVKELVQREVCKVGVCFDLFRQLWSLMVRPAMRRARG